MTTKSLHKRAQWLFVAGPSVMVTAPLLGFAFQVDQRVAVYRSAAEGLANPVSAFWHATNGIDVYLDRGNFRPVFRFLEAVSHGFVFEAAEATGMPPNVVHGIIRITMVGLLALTAAQVLSTILRSAGRVPSSHPMLALYPLILAMTLVAGDADGAITFYPFTTVGTSILVLAIALAVARDTDMTRRPITRTEALLTALLGAVAVFTYDLAYIAPPVAATLIIARNAAAGKPARDALRTAAVRRLGFLSTGFLVAFVPVRSVIAQRCSEADCNAASDLYLSSSIARHTSDRVATGMPPAGWHHVAELARQADRFGFGVAELLANSLLVVLATGIALMAVEAGKRAYRSSRDLPPAAERAGTPLSCTPSSAQTAPRYSTQSRAGWRCLAAGLGLFGLALAILAALLVSLSRWIHAMSYAIGEAWRDTVLVQTGWSFMIAAVGLMLTEAIRSKYGIRIVVWAAAVSLAVGCTATLLANQQLNRIDQETSLSAINNQIAAATIHFDRSGSGNTNRCNLLAAFASVTGRWNWEEESRQFRTVLDALMLNRYGQPFCDPSPVVGSAQPSTSGQSSSTSAT